jgi:uncharacterized protein (UPF0332 family)
VSTIVDTGLSFSSHSAVIPAYGKEYSKTKDLDPKFHKYLIEVQDFRSQGDYDYGPGVAASQVRNAVDWASEFLKAAKDFIGTNSAI